MRSVVPGTPRWAVLAAYGALASVLPSALWRTAVGFGVPLGWSDAQLRSQDIPGSGTCYVLALSAGSILAAALTLGLVQAWGDRFPEAVPFLGGRRVPALLVTVVAVGGALAVIGICFLSAVNWSSVSGFAGDTWSPGGILMMACYLPAVAWGPLLLAVTWAYWRRQPR